MSDKIGIALGGGGAKGMAHVVVLEAFDELGVRPHLITATSIGAIVGLLYAAGRTAAELRGDLDQLLLPKRDTFAERLRAILFPMSNYLEVALNGEALLETEGFVKALADATPARTFDDLKIPMKVVAADFWEREEVLIDSGDVIEAVHASAALPGIVQPVERDGRVLVDGGAVNPVPYNHLFDDCDVVVAVDVMGRRTYTKDPIPNVSEAIFNTFQIMQRSILRGHLEQRAPDLLIEPDITDVRVLEFDKAEQVLAQSAPAKDELKRFLEARLGTNR